MEHPDEYCIIFKTRNITTGECMSRVDTDNRHMNKIPRIIVYFPVTYWLIN